MRILENKKNILFNRQELVIEKDSENSPQFSELKKEISEKFSKPEENINVYSIKGQFGKKTFLVKSHVYESKEDLEKVKPTTNKERKEKRKAEEEAKKKAEEEKTETKDTEKKQENSDN